MVNKEDRLKVLKHIYNNKNASSHNIAEKLSYDKEDIKDILDYLEDKEFIKCDAITLDGNVHVIKLLSKGIEVVEENRDLTYSTEKPSINVVNQNKGPTVTSVSADQFKDVSFRNKGDFHIGPKVENISDNSINYETYSVDNTFIEKASISIINKYGEKKPAIFGIVALFAGITTILSGIATFLGGNNAFVSWLKWLAFAKESWGIPLISTGTIIAILGVFLIRVVEYKKESRCPRCKEFYCMKTDGDSEVREVPTHDGVRITRYTPYKCKKCGYTETRKEHDLIKPKSSDLKI